MGKFNKKDEGVKPTIVNHMGEKAYKPNAEEELRCFTEDLIS